jgi:peptidyl-prolyl cis-trans isomerase D
MLQWINDRMKVIGWFFLMPLSLVFAVWGVHGIVDFTANMDRGLKVNGQEANLEQVRQTYQQRLAEAARAYPEGMPDAVKKTLQQGVVDDFVATSLIDQKVAEQHYSASDAEVIASIKAYPGFQVGGEFNKDAYFALLKARGYSPEKFEAEQRVLIKAKALEGSLFVSSFATLKEAQWLTGLIGETREVAYATVPAAKFMAAQKPDAAAIKAYYDAHHDDYMTPDSVHLSYVELSLPDVAAEVAVDEAGLKAYYDTIKERFSEPEKRHARHIFLPTGTDEAATKKKAEEIAKLAAAPGADFAVLAKQYSQDTESASKGGDLGTQEKSFLPAGVGDTVFSMAPGTISGAVKSPFGYHIIQLVDVVPGKQKSFESVRGEVEPEYRRTEAERRFGERQEKLEQLAFESAGSLEPIAKALHLKIHDVPDFHKGMEGNDLALNSKVVTAVWSSDVLGGANSKALEMSTGRVVVVRAADHKVPTLEPLAAVQGRVEAALKRELAAKAAADAANDIARRLVAGESWDAALKAVGGSTAAPKGTPAADAIKYTAATSIARTDKDAPHDVVTGAFVLAAPAAGHVTVGQKTTLGGDVVVYAVSAVKPGEYKPDNLEAYRRLTSQYSAEELETYVAAMRAKAKISIGSTLFD